MTEHLSRAPHGEIRFPEKPPTERGFWDTCARPLHLRAPERPLHGHQSLCQASGGAPAPEGDLSALGMNECPAWGLGPQGLVYANSVIHGGALGQAVAAPDFWRGRGPRSATASLSQYSSVTRDRQDPALLLPWLPFAIMNCNRRRDLAEFCGSF